MVALSLQFGKSGIASADPGLHGRVHCEDRAGEDNAQVCIRVNYLNRVAGEEELLSVHSGSGSVEIITLVFPRLTFKSWVS